jgi:IMP dehydrogenase
VLNLEGLWTRYEDPDPLLDEIAGPSTRRPRPRMQEIYSASPDQAELITERLREIRARRRDRRRP